MIEDFKGDESWRIISEFTEGIDRLSGLGFAVSIFGSARLDANGPDFVESRQSDNPSGNISIKVGGDMKAKTLAIGHGAQGWGRDSLPWKYDRKSGASVGRAAKEHHYPNDLSQCASR